MTNKIAPASKITATAAAPKAVSVNDVRIWVLSQIEDRVIAKVNAILVEEAQEAQRKKGWMETLRTDAVKPVQYKTVKRLVKQLDDLSDEVARAVRKQERRLLADAEVFGALLGHFGEDPIVVNYLASVGKLRRETVAVYAERLEGLMLDDDDFDAVAVLCNGRKVSSMAGTPGDLSGLGGLVGNIVGGVIRRAVVAASSDKSFVGSFVNSVSQATGIQLGDTDGEAAARKDRA